MIANGFKFSHQRLRAFVDVKEDCDLIVSVVIVFHLGIDLYVGKTVCLVLVFDVANITAKQGLAITPMSEEKASSLHLHVGEKLLTAKIPISRDFDPHHPMPFARIDLVDDANNVMLGVRFPAQFDRGFEISTGFHVTQQVAAPLGKQVIIESVLFIDRDASANCGLAQSEPLHLDENSRSGINSKGVIHGVGLGSKFCGCNLDLSKLMENFKSMLGGELNG